MKTTKWSLQELNYVCDYHPFRVCGTPNPNKNQDTYRIMDMKDPTSHNFQRNLAYFQGVLLAFFRSFPEFINFPVVNIAIIPSSTAGNSSVALTSIISHLNLNLGPRLIYNPDFLVRTKSIPSAHNGGARSAQIHLDSIEVKARINGDLPMILLDDVYTTGSSMAACEQLLRNAGVKKLYKLVLGKTV
ncbi:ComF family protein [Pseudoalteromonas sp. T1lg48]|uniref:ComF family protein n=1 Tax=Pseudoalteromonas sp. T1lg48 TaxID=2077100 RepID=UPI001319FCB7|nr:hypothetical protein [Pseudoalteromonas sp. T1lg48]